MFSAILSFIGGSAFRMIWGEVSAWLNKKLEHQQELDRIREQEKIDQAKHARQQELIRLQHELGIKAIQVAGDVETEKLAAEAFANAMKDANRPTGVKWVDAWNATIRPSAATISLALWVGNLAQAAFVLTDWDRNLIGAIFGYFFADRSLAKRSK